MLFQNEQFDDEIEEIRELFYNIIKDFPTGITSTFLEKQFVQRYVEKGLAHSLPKNWLNLLRHAEEFQVRDVSTFTILYLADAKIPTEEQWTITPADKANSNDTAAALNVENDEKQEKGNGNSQVENENANANAENADEIIMPISQFRNEQFETMAISSLPDKNNGPIVIQIISSFDPDNIFIRLKTWDPYCEYLNAALCRLPQKKNFVDLEVGQILGAKIDGNWQRVELIRQSKSNPKFWIVNLLDNGFYCAVHEDALRPLTESVTAFKKIFLAVCKLDGIKSRCQTQNDDSADEIRWPPETQHYINEALQPAILRKKRMEFCPTSEWRIHADKKIPICIGRLLIDGIDFGEQLVSMGLAQRK